MRRGRCCCEGDCEFTIHVKDGCTGAPVEHVGVALYATEAEGGDPDTDHTDSNGDVSWMVPRGADYWIATYKDGCFSPARRHVNVSCGGTEVATVYCNPKSFTFTFKSCCSGKSTGASVTLSFVNPDSSLTSISPARGSSVTLPKFHGPGTYRADITPDEECASTYVLLGEPVLPPGEGGLCEDEAVAPVELQPKEGGECCGDWAWPLLNGSNWEVVDALGVAPIGSLVVASSDKVIDPGVSNSAVAGWWETTFPPGTLGPCASGSGSPRYTQMSAKSRDYVRRDVAYRYTLSCVDGAPRLTVTWKHIRSFRTDGYTYNFTCEPIGVPPTLCYGSCLGAAPNCLGSLPILGGAAASVVGGFCVTNVPASGSQYYYLGYPEYGSPYYASASEVSASGVFVGPPPGSGLMPIGITGAFSFDDPTPTSGSVPAVIPPPPGGASVVVRRMS